ncbi:PTS system glucose-specific IIA component [Virgibacillus natechei]|uniref:PTS system glucose-specific IIA component n=1 Tax=Virgibacillus natechei TaxID=1216297 RepID=A0ABS4IK96_9BACI|nr:PTS glucose transporter subunit IIA [Virgibacillus natechei]MBP1971383.1 PTS system glucose-specific IIA component [Virgibacillus natechei]UZD12244.1 PTS glucose transporter subunit IIA [Virgibacillus natechei]
MFGKLFKKKEEVTDISLVAPVSGVLVALEDVPDPVFSQKMMGDGVAVKPSNGEVVAPIDGKIVQVFPTKHAVGIMADNGAEIMIHIGLETVSLEGEGFTAHVGEGDRIKQGDKLITFDLQVIGEKAKDTVTPIIVTNTDDMSEISVEDKKEVTAGQDEIVIVKK